MNRAHCTTQDNALGAGLGAVLSQGVAGGAGPLGHLAERLVLLPFSALEVLMTWQERASQRQCLRQMDDRLLADMGLSRADVDREASIPFWRQS